MKKEEKKKEEEEDDDDSYDDDSDDEHYWGNQREEELCRRYRERIYISHERKEDLYDVSGNTEKRRNTVMKKILVRIITELIMKIWKLRFQFKK